MAGKDTVPKITWEASFANTIDFGHRLDNVRAFEDPQDGSEFLYASSGEFDAWVTGDKPVLEADVRWIPTTDITTPVVKTGWDGATGWREFLKWARDGNTFRFFPDKDGVDFIPCTIRQPLRGGVNTETDGRRRVRIVITSTDGSTFDGY